MKFLTLLLQAAAPAAGAQAQPQGGGWSMWIMLIVIFAVMWLFMIRPQRKQQKEMEQFRSSLKKGDKVITAGGIYGTIAEVKDNERTVLLKVDGDVKLRIDKSSLQKDPSAAPAAPEEEKKQ
ncbi:MAG: preprotein translocase subunit YajC [Bacteroidales bacterium]|nr:preprotein translocase subunit YajC [Bacteroidales bacterium]